MVGALEIYTVYLGERLGLYRALAADGPATSAELAGRTATDERYVREWLEHHAASGLLEVDDPAVGPLARRYRAAAASVRSPCRPRRSRIPGVQRRRDRARADGSCRTLWTRSAPEVRSTRCRGRRKAGPTTTARCAATCWGRGGCPGIADVPSTRLRERPAGPGCRPGLRPPGGSSIAIAQNDPLVRRRQLRPMDADVIEAARRNAAHAEMSGRVTFAVTDASGAGLVRPVRPGDGLRNAARHGPALFPDALRTARAMLTPDRQRRHRRRAHARRGFTAPATELERYHYGWSVVACLPGAMGDPQTAATGAPCAPRPPAQLRRGRRAFPGARDPPAGNRELGGSTS